MSLFTVDALRRLLIPDGDAKQVVRIRRFLFAQAVYALCLPLLIIARALGLLTGPAMAALAVVIVALNVGLYTVLRTGLNRRLADPSFTHVQTIAAIFVVMCTAYALDHERTVVLILCPVVLMFGAFRFTMREFLVAAAVVQLGYLVVIYALLEFKPETIDLRLEMYRWFVLACVLPAFAITAGKVSQIRQRLRNTNDSLTSALATIRHLAAHDALTGLPNRVLFGEHLKKAIERSQRRKLPVAILFLDLDRFKNVNDILGHLVGDRVLQETAARLTACIRESDVAARFAGDEFVVLMEECGGQDALVEVAQRVLTALYRPMMIDGREINLSASIGICTYPDAARDGETLLANADMAMYRAKETGRNRFQFFAPQAATVAADRMELEAGLRHALERNEFRLHYQPKVSIASGEITGVEVLLRWQHPKKGMLTPDKFIRIAEDSGLIVPIGLWMLRMACSTARAWQGQGLVLPVAVNLSAREFLHGDLVAELGEVLEDTNLAPHLLELEITETMVMQNPERSVRIMDDLRRMGLKLTMDDFGTGYSSLANLKHFPVHNLKLDRSFVKDLSRDIRDVAITRAVIAMAHTLKMNVIAEGVEQPLQLELLRAEGCDEFQGYLCRPAMPEDALLRFMREAGWRKRAAPGVGAAVRTQPPSIRLA